jgi:hypothetical protein
LVPITGLPQVMASNTTVGNGSKLAGEQTRRPRYTPAPPLPAAASEEKYLVNNAQFNGQLFSCSS